MLTLTANRPETQFRTPPQVHITGAYTEIRLKRRSFIDYELLNMSG